MRILLIRHASPAYATDSLTERGHREAELLGEYLKNTDLGHVYTSPMGRARETMQHVLDAQGKSEYGVLDWTIEFEIEVDNHNDELRTTYAAVNMGDDGTIFPRVPWDMYPRALTTQYLDPVDWLNAPVARHSDIPAQYKYVTEQLDKLLAEHGYVRNGLIYNCDPGNHETITIFCHFGVQGVLLSHLLNTSPHFFWQNFCAAPSALTELVTEEREEGIASFRCLRLGSTAHLDMGNMEPAFSARYCEAYQDDDRH